MSARENILKRLRTTSSPFTHVDPIQERRPVVPMNDADLTHAFIQKAEALSAHVYQPETESAAIDAILTIIGTDTSVLAWDFEHIPLPTLEATFTGKNIAVADPRDDQTRVGITGVDAALSATGSLVIAARPGRPRSVSLLPYAHIAVLTRDQILPHFDAWVAAQSAQTQDFRTVGNHTVITGGQPHRRHRHGIGAWCAWTRATPRCHPAELSV